MEDFHEVISDVKHSVMNFGSADPEKMLTLLAANFRKAGNKCDKHLSYLSLIDEKFDICIVAIQGKNTA